MIKSVKDLLSELRQQNINLILNEEDKIEITVSKGKIPSEVISEIKEQKDHIIDYLKSIKKTISFQIDKVEESDSYVISSSQKSLWIVSQIDASSSAYNISSTIKLTDIKNPVLLENAIESVVDRHEILRTVFKQDENGEIRQIVLTRNQLDFKVKYKDYRNEKDSELQIASFIESDSLKPFDLAKGPLLRIFLLQNTDNTYTFYYIMHHIITDGWSNEILEREVLSFYESNLMGTAPNLPELRLQYKDYAAWEHKQLGSEMMKVHKKYWVENLSGELPVLNLPTNKTRPRIKSHNGKNLITFISSDKVELLKKIMQSEEGSLYMGFLTVLKILLYKYTNEKDLIVGSVIAGREELDLQDQIGYYVKVLTLRNQLEEQDSFLSFFRRLKDNVLLAYKHQDYPFDELLNDLNLKKDTSRSPLFDFIVGFHNIKEQNRNKSEINFDTIQDLGEYVCKSDVEFHFEQIEDFVCLNIIYNTDVYEFSMISQLMHHFKSLLNVVLESPQTKITQIDYLSNIEKDQVLVQFNKSGVEYQKDKTLVTIFEDQIIKTPQNIAIDFEDLSLTYYEVNKKSNQLAHYLRAKYKIKPDDLVGIKLERSEKMITSILGVLKSGGAYVPIDPSYPQERIEYIEKDIKSKVIIDEQFLELFYTKQEQYSKSNPENINKPQDLAYVIYTSGTTGNPKGVMIEHGGVVNLIKVQSVRFNISDNEIICQFSNLAFDASVEQIFLALLNGAVLSIIDKSSMYDNKAIEAFIEQKKITHFHTVPSVIEKIEPKKYSFLKRMVSGGDICSVELANRWEKHCNFYNEYGPTETTVTAIELLHDKNQHFSIGSPIANTQVYILDQENQLLPPYLSGKIYISGSGLARGYLNRPELTQEKFISNPFIKGELMYDTGDIARWLPDGNIDFLGRIDDQVKVRGHRIELGEIEKRLYAIKNINQSVVVVNNKDGDKFLVAYYVSDIIIDKKEIQSGLAKTLPDYMLPSYYIQLESIPVTVNGKVDRKSLPDVHETDLIKEEYIAPTTQKEEILALVWSGVLGYETISIKDSFYNLGGDSIKSILVISRLKQKGYTLKVEQILRNPVLEDLAKLMQSNTVTIDQAEIEGEVFLTPIQHYFFENELIANKNYYNQSVLLFSALEIRSDILEDCISSLVKHHDALRMVYTFENDHWKQYNKDSSGQHHKIDFYDLRQEEDERTAMLKIAENLQSSFDISLGVLFQVVHFRLSDGDRLALIVHHLVIDGISWRILLEDLSGLYNSYKSESKFVLPLKTDSFMRWSNLQKDFANSGAMKKERKYWEAVSKESVPLLPVDYNQNESVSKLNKEKGFSLSKALTDKLQTQVHNVYKTEINDILLTGLALAIREVFGVEKTVIQMEGHGREDIMQGIDIGRTVGWFTSIYPFVLDITNSNSYELVNVKDSLRKIPNKGIGYGILNYLDEKFENTLSPGIQFNYLGDFGDSAEGHKDDALFTFSSESIGSSIDLGNSQSSILLDVSGMIVSKELSMSFQYSAENYAEETIEKLINSYKHHLTALITNVSEIKKSYLTPSDLTYKKLSFKELMLINKANNIEDIYVLSPLQQGLYYHWLLDHSSPMYFEQMAYTVNSQELSVKLVQQAFNELISRYSVLRTAFSSSFGSEPLQIVYKTVEGNFSYEKITANDEQTINEDIEKIKEADKIKGFDFEKPSLMRLKVIEVKKGRYVFVWSHHHILMDGWCISILINDFTAILKAISTNQKIDLPTPVKYAEYINWLSKVDKDLSLSYWKDHLKGLETVIDIPFKDKREKATDFKASEETLLIDGDVFIKLSNLCQELSITPNVFMQGVWGYLLSRYNNTQDVIFGSVVSGRPGELTGVEDMVGLFINTIPVRLQYTNDDTPKSLLKRLQAEAIESTLHHYMNLSEVQSQSELGQDLLNTIMVFENYFVHEDTSEDNIQNTQKIVLEEVNVFEQTNYDFHITISTSLSSLEVEFKYNSEVFDQDLIKNLVSHFFNITEQFSAEKEVLLTQIEYLTLKEREQLLVDFNASEVDYPKEKTILDLFKEQIKKTPNNIAVVFEDKKITYKELDNLSSQLCYTLIEDYKIEKGDMIGVLLNRSELSIISILGILKSGAVYIPIDSELPDNRKAFIIEDTALKLLITETFFILDVDFYEGDVFCVDVEFESTDKDLTVDKINLTLNDLAYIIYTSGSTGNPKGVMIEHSSLTNYLTWAKEYYLSENLINNNFGLFTSLSFDLTITSLFLPLISGGALNIYPSTTQVQNLLENYINNDLSCIKLTPSHISVLGTLGVKSDKLEVAIVGGEELRKEHIEILRNINPSIRIYNEYGPTEATVGCVIEEIKSIGDKILIGRPIWNTSIYILNEFNKIQPQGILGEIYIGGSGLARGYLNRLDLTSEKFIPNPFKEGELIYKTGDLGRWLTDGTIDYKGRKDDQVKIRGYRIELGEIESQLLLLNQVSEALVIVDENEGDKFLVAYYVAAVTLDKKEIKSTLSKVLVEYMLPNYYVQLDAIPLTTNGKADRKSLPRVNVNDLIKEEYVAPVTNEEILLVSIWSEVLNYDKISIKDSFYNLGGDSIKIIRVISLLKQKGYTLKVEQILSNPIIEDLAKLVENNTVFVDQSEAVGEVAITPIQYNFFENDAIFNKSHYNQSIVLRSRLVIDSLILEQSISSLVLHHDALRMVYKQENNRWLQYNEDSLNKHYKINFYDLQKESKELEALHRIGDELQSSFDISSGVLFQIGHFRLSDGDCLVLIIHHLVVDGVSWRILLEDLSNIYQAYKSGSDLKLPLKTDSFLRWSHLQKDFAKSEEMQSERHYWERISKESIPLLPTDFKNIVEVSKLDNESSFILDKLITEKLKTKIHHVYRTEINDVLLTALALSIREVFGVSKTVIKVEGHGREEIIEDIDIGRTVGWFTTVYPFVLDVSNSKGNELISIKESLRKVPNKGIGYGILNYLDKRFENQLSPSMQFNYLGDFGSNSSSDKDESIFELSSENVGSESDPDNNPTNILLDVSGVMFSEQLSMTIRYSGNLFKQETIDKLIVSYKNQLTNIINELSVIQSNTLSTINSKYDLDDQQWEYGDMLETSPNQRRFLKLESSSVTVNFEISSFNAVTFQEKFREFLSKFPALTLEFVKDKEQLLQRYISPEKVKIKWLIIDMPPVQSDDIDTIGREFLLNKFDIFNQELIRVFVLQKDAYAKIFVSVHHSLADNYTGKILKKELIEFFKDNNIEKANYYHPFTFVKYQKKFLASKLGLKERNHWIKKLADIPLLSKEIVTNNKEFDFIIQETIISDEYFENIKKFSENVNLPVSTMFNAFFEMILNGLTVFDKKIYRVLVDCREQEIKNLEVLKIVGVIDNMLPIVYEDSNFDIEAIRKCYSKYLETRLYQTIPYEIIREDLIDATNKDLDKNTLGYFNFIVDEGDIYINDLNRQSIKYADKNPDFKGVNLSCTLFTNAIKLKLVCDKEIYDAKTAQISLENVLEKFYKLINSNT